MVAGLAGPQGGGEGLHALALSARIPTVRLGIPKRTGRICSTLHLSSVPERWTLTWEQGERPRHRSVPEDARPGKTTSPALPASPRPATYTVTGPDVRAVQVERCRLIRVLGLLQATSSRSFDFRRHLSIGLPQRHLVWRRHAPPLHGPFRKLCLAVADGLGRPNFPG